MKQHLALLLIIGVFSAALLLIYGITTKSIIYCGVLAFFAMWEIFFPAFPIAKVSKSKRWITNLSLTFMLPLLATLPSFLVAIQVKEAGWGLFHIEESLPTVLYIIVSIVALDLAIFLQHVLFHKVPLLWRLHKVHHTELAFDVSTAGRFHPLSGIIAALNRIIVILFLGIGPIGLSAYLLTVTISLQFVHSNAYVPPKLEKIMRLIFSTPQMHYVHHSSVVKETNSNYAGIFSFWDRMIGTYREAPEAGYEAMELGLKEYRDEKALSFWKLLVIPFKKDSNV